MHRNRYSRPMLAALVISLFAAACSGGETASEPDAPSPTTTEAARVVTSAPSVAPTTTATPPPPPELTIDPTGEDFERIYRELDAARDYLYRNPTAADPLDFVGGVAGADQIAWIADHGYRVEPVDGTYTVDSVKLHARVSDDRVHLFVTDTSNRSTQVLDADDAVVSTWAGRDEDATTRHFIVTLERGADERWRILADDAVATAENTDGIYTPVRIADEVIGQSVGGGTVDTTDHGTIDWKAHSWVDALSDGACVDFVIAERSRFVRCVSEAEQARLLEGSQVAFWAIPSEEFGIELRLLFGVRAPLELAISRRDGAETVIVGEPFVEGSQIGGAVAAEHWELAVYTVDGQEVNRDEAFNSHDCGEWAENLPIEETVLSDWGLEGESRAATRKELTDAIFDKIDDYYYVPELEVLDGSEPPAFDAAFYPNLPAEPDLFNVTASNWSALGEGRSVTWSHALAEDASGWHIVTAAFRMDCEPGVGNR